MLFSVSIFIPPLFFNVHQKHNKQEVKNRAQKKLLLNESVLQKYSSFSPVGPRKRADTYGVCPVIPEDIAPLR